MGIVHQILQVFRLIFDPSIVIIVIELELYYLFKKFQIQHKTENSSKKLIREEYEFLEEHLQGLFDSADMIPNHVWKSNVKYAKIMIKHNPI